MSYRGMGPRTKSKAEPKATMVFCAQHGGVYWPSNCAECKLSGKLKEFKVTMEGFATVRGTLVVKATSSRGALNEATERTGDIVWEYKSMDKVIDALTEVTEVK